MRWAIFCRVIDNYGDAGVCWRLAADLNQRGEHVTLYIDQPEILAKLIDPARAIHPIQTQAWPGEHQQFEPADIADVVIEAFACDPPIAYIESMAKRADAGTPPIWINLEYLSAEDWVADHHLLTSPHPRYPLIKHFYFPGFTVESGGLLREPGLVSPTHGNHENKPEAASPLRIFLFSYEQPALAGWINALRDTCVSIAPCPAMHQLTAMALVMPQSVAVETLPFVPQPAFDVVLAAHDILFVRGEDSFVRAQWAAKPLFWQIYPQTDGAHIKKLSAFYERYLDAKILTTEQRESVMRFVLSWNGVGDPNDCAVLWPAMLQLLPALRQNALAWRENLLKQADLVTQLQSFVADLVK